jgi:hypothetical protein
VDQEIHHHTTTRVSTLAPGVPPNKFTRHKRAAEEAAEAALATAKHRVNPEPPTKNVETQLTNTKRQVETKNGRKVIKPRAWEG